MTPTLRNAPKNEKPKDWRIPKPPYRAAFYVMAVYFLVHFWQGGNWSFSIPSKPPSAKTRYELSLERDNAELRETNQAYQRALRTALDDAKAITDRFSRTVFPVEDQKFLVDLLTKENEQLRTDKAVEIEKRLIMAREANWIEKNVGEKVAVKVEENE